jgi:hypothetical protein
LTTFEDKETEKKEKVGKDINYYVLAAIFGAIVLFDITNAMEPQVDAELDFYELMRMLGFAAASIFAFAQWQRDTANQRYLEEHILRSGSVLGFILLESH